jgi:chaperonin cofactor prefoldin
MFDQEEEEKSLEQKVKDLHEDVQLLRMRVGSLESEMERIKEQLRKMSFTPGL